MTSRLIRRPRTVNPELLTDFLLLVMANVEDALQEAGGTAGIDYKYMDVLNAALPFAMDDKSLLLTTEWQ